MKLRSACSLFVCAALAMTLAGCGSSAEAAPGPAEATPGPADTVRKFFVAIRSDDYAMFVENTTASFSISEEEFHEASRDAGEHPIEVHVGRVRMDGDTACVELEVIPDEDPDGAPGEAEATVRKLNGIWKVDRIGPSKESATLSAVANNGKQIVTAIWSANIDRAAQMYSEIWPNKGKYQDSNAYFAKLMGDGGKAILTGISFSTFAGGGVEPAADMTEFKRRGNVWTMLAGIGTCSDSRMPFIWTHNLRLTQEDLEAYVRDPYTERSLADRLDPSVKPFGDDAVVMITKYGLMYRLKASELTTKTFFGNAVPDNVDSLEIVEPCQSARSSSYGTAERISATRTTISMIESAAQAWETRHFKNPDSLDLLLQPDGDREPLLPAKVRTDAWGNEIQFRLNGRRMEIRSAGPDGRMNTSDDVTN